MQYARSGSYPEEVSQEIRCWTPGTHFTSQMMEMLCFPAMQVAAETLKNSVMFPDTYFPSGVFHLFAVMFNDEPYFCL